MNTREGLLRLSFLFALSASLVFAAHRASAQYFGQNKVVYRSFDFKIMKTDHFDIYFYSEEEPAVAVAARMAERWYARHAKMLGHELVGRQPLILYASSPQFGETNVISGQIGEGTGGVTEALRRRIILPFAGPLAETDHVIGHELVHAFQYSITGIKGGGGGFQNSPAEKLPLWFIEGMAEFLSLGPDDPNTAMWVRDATKSMKKLPTIRQLQSREYFPYRWGQALLAYIAGKWGDDKIGALLDSAGASGDIDAAIKQVLLINSDSLSKEWHAAMHEAYDPISKVTKSPGDYGRQIIGQKRGGGRMNVGPVLSPDGKNLIFYSERNLFAIDLFLADAETGKIKRNIVRTELDPHFSSLEFIYSAGAWDPGGKRIVFSAIVKDRPTLSILDMERDKVTEEINFKNLDEVFNPAWSPDGRYIVVSALARGVAGLFVYDLDTDSLRRLTDDAYADLQPAWSPDGKQIAFVTDRFSTGLPDLKMGRYQIALLDPISAKIDPVHIFGQGKVINPQWSPDGGSLYFLADHNGISNIYRHDLNDGRTYQVTDLYAGASGITDISPGISVAADRLVFSAYEDGKYDIYLVDSLSTKSVTQPAALEPGLAEDSVIVNPAMLPPIDRSGGELLGLLDDATFGLPSEQNFEIVHYHPKLSVDYVGQPYVAAGVDPLGVQLGGGIALFWSDMLGDYNLATAFQLQTDGGFTDGGALVGYQNNKHRWIWGGVVQQFPYTLVQYAAGYDSVGGAYIQQQYSFRQINREISGLASYPFDKVKRVEFSGGYRHASFEQKVRTQAFDPVTNALISDQTVTLPSLNAIDIGAFSGAFVYDNAIYGAMSPLMGQRSRLETEPIFGTISLYTLLADYRRYEMPFRPFTFAFRLLHYGRYGKDSEDNRLTPLFIGYQDLVRGYDAGSFNAADSIYDRLFGSSMAVANFEVRFPLFGALHLGGGYYGALPIETGVFYDAGVTWSKGQKPSFLKNGDRKPVRSYGALIRASILGYLVLEVDYVKPQDRHDRGAFWQFNISPGF